MNDKLEHFNKLYAIDCTDKTEQKSTGSSKLTYLSWTYAWAEVKKIFPNAKYEILKFGENKLPYVYDEKTGYMVFTQVEIEGIEHEMWLPVMDSANKAMKDKSYEYKVKEYSYGKWTGGYTEKTVEPATMFDINKAIMRCLTKNLAMFGLGLYIYAGEDLPENITDKNNKKETTTPYDFMSEEEKLNASPILETQKQQIKDKLTADEIKQKLINFKKSKLSDLTYGQAKLVIDEIDKKETEKVEEKEEVF